MTNQQSQGASQAPEDVQHIDLGTGSFGYSTVGLDTLNNVGTRFTLVTAVGDVSPSTSSFQGHMEKALQEVVKSCGSSPERDTFLYRLMLFAVRMEEVHGFRPLTQCPPDMYDGALKKARLGGRTSLYDATINSLEATRVEARRLGSADFDVNACVFVITDGLDNESAATMNDVRAAFESLKKEEYCESVLPILIGVNITDPEVSLRLDQFHKDSGFAQYVELDNADAKTLAKLAQFIAKSASSQSQSLGSGGPSKPIDINTI